MKLLTLIASLVLLAGRAQSETWTCAVPYDEVNGGGKVTVQRDRMTFVSNWPHRQPEVMTCITTGLVSECLSAALSKNRNGGVSVFAALYSIAWTSDGEPENITMRQPSAIFEEHDTGYTLFRAFPAIGYTFPVTDCASE